MFLLAIVTAIFFFIIKFGNTGVFKIGGFNRCSQQIVVLRCKMCDTAFLGYEYDKSINRCVSKTFDGISKGESPFQSLEECQAICEK